MRKYLAAVVAILSLSLPAQASDQPCPDPARPFHVLPFCLTQAEYLALTTITNINNPTPAPVAVSLEGQVRVMAYHFWPDWAAERMVRIAKCESNYEPGAVNPRSGASGIWQVMPFWQRAWPGDYLDPWTNAAVAYQIWLVQGFGAWVCRA